MMKASTGLTLLATLLVAGSFVPHTVSAARSLPDGAPEADDVSGAPLGMLFSGDGTAYSEAVENGTGFACSYRHLNDWSRKYFVAINNDQWEEGRNCGRCVMAKCTDPMCTTAEEEVKLYITDKCPECKKGDLDLSIPAYREVTGLWPHRLQFSWKFVDCGDSIQGTIKMDPKDGINDHWAAFYLSNMRYPVVSATLDGYKMQREQFGFWIFNKPLADGPHTLELTSENGEKLTTAVEDVLQPGVDLGVQFKIGP